jgi:hypothetical protein
MPRGRTARSQRGKPGGNARSGTGGRLATSLGAGVPGEVIPLPLSLQSRKTLFFRGIDAFGVKGAAFGIGVDSVPLTNGSPTQVLANWLTACGNWANAATVYEQFRVRRMRLRGVPTSNLLTAGVPFVLAYDATNDYPVAPTGAEVAAYRTSKILETSEPFELTYEIPAPAQNLWFDSIMPTNWAGALLINNVVNQPTSVGFLPYSNVMFEFEVEMRGIGP